MKKYILTLTNENNNVIGYYCSDDNDVVDNIKDALILDSISAAEQEAKLTNATWELNAGEQFCVTEI